MCSYYIAKVFYLPWGLKLRVVTSLFCFLEGTFLNLCAHLGLAVFMGKKSFIGAEF